MKKIIMIVACMSTAFLYAMENNSNTLSFLINQTTIRLTKGSMYSVDGKVDIMFVGRHQQGVLNDFFEDDMYASGEINKLRNDSVYIKNNDIDSDSDNDEWYLQEDKYNDTGQIDIKKLHSKCLNVLEPRITYRQYGHDKETKDCLHYFVLRPHVYFDPIHRKMSDYSPKRYYGNKAIKEALNDLAVCYYNALVEGLKQLGKKEKKSIALPVLGVDFGIPREKAASVAVPTIIRFAKKYFDKYDSIELFVKKRADFKRYMRLLMDDSRLTEKISLLYCANEKDKKSFFALLPRDIIHYIALFIV